MTERWKQIEKHEGYFISSLGKIIGPSGRPIKFGINRGYAVSRIRTKNYRIHRLVLEYFIGPQPGPDFECDHIDNDKLNNNVGNLQWVTKEQNSRFVDERGRRAKGSRVHTSKLKEDDIRFILSNYSYRGEWDSKKLARKFGVCSSTIREIIYRDNWKHVDITKTKGEEARFIEYASYQKLLDRVRELELKLKDPK